ncbi:MAG: GntR family transcriptional regulator [Boseongicola sp.]
MASRQVTWKDVREKIHVAILEGIYTPGDKLPRDLDIAEDLNCARTTVQRAMRDLADSGIVERRRKGGTRVRPDPVIRATLDIPDTRKEVEAKGATYGYQLIRRSFQLAPRDIVARFGLSEPEQMLRVEALHLADNRPYTLEDRWVSTNTVPEILDIDLATQSANEWLIHNKPYSRFDLRFYAESADPATSELLAVPAGNALLVIERTTWIGNSPITTLKATTCPDYQLRAAA